MGGGGCSARNKSGMWENGNQRITKASWTSTKARNARTILFISRTTDFDFSELSPVSPLQTVGAGGGEHGEGGAALDGLHGPRARPPMGTPR